MQTSCKTCRECKFAPVQVGEKPSVPRARPAWPPFGQSAAFHMRFLHLCRPRARSGGAGGGIEVPGGQAASPHATSAQPATPRPRRLWRLYPSLRNLYMGRSGRLMIPSRIAIDRYLVNIDLCSGSRVANARSSPARPMCRAICWDIWLKETNGSIQVAAFTCFLIAG